MGQDYRVRVLATIKHTSDYTIRAVYPVFSRPFR